jgi:hypothetical protein
MSLNINLEISSAFLKLLETRLNSRFTTLQLNFNFYRV